MIIYLSGPMSGIKDFNYPEFNAVAKRLRAKGYTVINPAEIVPMIQTWEMCMRQDIKAMMDADKVAVLEGWERSKGAKIEVKLALDLNMEVIDAYTMESINLVEAVI